MVQVEYYIYTLLLQIQYYVNNLMPQVEYYILYPESCINLQLRQYFIYTQYRVISQKLGGKYKKVGSV